MPVLVYERALPPDMRAQRRQAAARGALRIVERDRRRDTPGTSLIVAERAPGAPRTSSEGGCV